jgi:hypothetical protein
VAALTVVKQSPVLVALVFVIGISGSGKSTVCNELTRRGYLARDSDSFSRWRAKSTGELVGPHERDDAFVEQHDWVIDIDEVAALAEAAGDGTAYLCGSASNEDEVWPFASQVICLAIDDDTLRERLRTRTTNDFGKSDYELGLCLEWNATAAEDNAAHGATVIDATQPLAVVVDEVLRVSGIA